MIPIPPQILIALAARFHQTPQSLAYLGGGQESSDGIAYAFAAAQGPRVLKILPLTSDEQRATLEERLRFVRYLGDHGVAIVFPIPLESGDLYTIAGEGAQRFVAYAMPRATGVHPRPGQFAPPFYTQLGRVLGKMHRVTQTYPVWRSASDPHSGRPILGWEPEWQDFYTWAKDPALKAQWLSIRERLAALPVERDSFGFIHNDAHAENLFLDGDRLTLIDFDVANCHWFINDIAIAMQPLLFRVTGGLDRPCQGAAPLRHFLEHFLRGYEQENHLDEAWLAHLDLFFHYRSALLYTVSQDGLAARPQLQSRWKAQVLHPQPILNG